MQAQRQTAYSNHLQTTSYGVTEIVLPQGKTQAQILLPTLAYLSQQTGNRWLTWIVPSMQIAKSTLQQYGFNTDQLRLVYTPKQEDILWVLWEALATGNSQTVIASPGKLSGSELYKLELAAQQGKSQGLFIRYR